MAPALRTFLVTNHISNKKVLPVITHGGTKEGKLIEDLHMLMTNVIIAKPLVVWQNEVDTLMVKKWLTENNVKW